MICNFRNIISLIFLSLVLTSVKAQKVKDNKMHIIINDTVHIIMHDDPKYIKQKGEYDPGVLRKGLSDGRWIAFYDNGRQDTAMTASISNGAINGLLKKMDRKGNVIAEWYYENGLKNGLCKDYIYIYDDLENNIFLEIYIMEYEKGVVIHEEIKSKVIEKDNN